MFFLLLFFRLQVDTSVHSNSEIVRPKCILPTPCSSLHDWSISSIAASSQANPRSFRRRRWEFRSVPSRPRRILKGKKRRTTTPHVVR